MQILMATNYLSKLKLQIQLSTLHLLNGCVIRGCIIDNDCKDLINLSFEHAIFQLYLNYRTIMI